MVHKQGTRLVRQALYQFNRMLSEIDGFLLFPDNRVLSPVVLTEMLKESARRQVQVAVFGESLLAHGATFSASAVDSDIAAKIAIALNDVLEGKVDELSDLSALSEIQITVNDAMAARFGLLTEDPPLDDSVADAQ